MDTLTAKTLEALTAKGFTVHHVSTQAEARALALAFIPDGASVGIGGSMTIQELGLYDALRERGAHPHWHWRTDEPRDEALRAAACSDVYLLSANAITANGCLVNIDGTGNRVGALIAGPKQVIVIAGANKLVDGGIPQAIARIKTIACPLNARRLGKSTPCALEGRCNAAICRKSMCSVTSVIERPLGGHPITIILADEAMGY